MTQNPYAQPPAFDTHAPVAARTSVAAILALVCALVCFVPGLGVLAVILGIAALFLISSSQGRVTGKGLAISGILIGLLVTFVWGIAAVGVTSAMSVFGTKFMAPMSNLFQALEKQDYATARTLMNTPSGTPAATDEQFDAFVTAYQAEVGTFQSMPTGVIEFFGSLQKVQGFFQPAPGQPHIPVPTEFSNGTAVVLLEFPQGSNPGSSPNPSALPIVNIGVASAAGNRIWLLPSATTGTPGTPTPTPPTTPDPTPAGDGETAPGGSGGDADAGNGSSR